MRIENKKNIEGQPPSFKDRSSDLKSTNQCHILREQHNRIIKLIREKKYPLHASNRSALVFPKLKENFAMPKDAHPGNFKKYFEVNLDDERSNPHARVRTDIEQELIQKYQLDMLKKNSQHETSEFNQYTKLIKSKKNRQSLKRKTLNDEQNQPHQPNRHSSHLDNTYFDSTTLVSDLLSSSSFSEETLLHTQFMAAVKSKLSQKKEDFLRKLNFNEMLPGSSQKEQCSIQYIISVLQRKQQKDHSGSISAYQNTSPNNIQKYLTLLNRKEKKLNIWQQFEKAESLKERINEDELKSMHLVEKARKRNIAVVEDENEFQQENLLSAKYRMKSNHRKIIQINRAKPKN